MRKWIIPIMVVCFFSVAVSSPVEAGDRSRHRWQGIAIGAASTLLLQHVFSQPVAVEAGYYAPAPRRDYRYGYAPGPFCPPGQYRNRHYRESRGPVGYWESVWIPGHYDAYGKYVDGHYERYYISQQRYD